MTTHTTRRILLAAAVAVMMSCLSTARAGSLVLVEKGRALAPIVIFKDAPPFTRRAADELAAYIEKTTGARPSVIEGEPKPMPEKAIWVGYQPALKELFPKVDFEFKHPEEILIAANDKHLVIAGRDRWDPKHMTLQGRKGEKVDGVQQEYGTCNAVYTFLQDYLGVRWFWPGESGEDVLRRDTLAFEPFEYRYHPQFRARQGVFVYCDFAGQGHSKDWVRLQRLQLDSLDFDTSHAFRWWDRFHETNPEFFALQPDGTRGGNRPFPDGRNVKMCKSNPAVWEQWLKEVEAQLKRNPNKRMFSAAPNDGGAQGFCVCENCRAWDPAEGPLVRFEWRGASRDAVGLADRQIIFANQLGRLLKARYPGKDYYVTMMAYGVSRPPPVTAVPDDNVIVSLVFNFHNRPSFDARISMDHRELFLAWGRKGFKNIAWRPNLGDIAGWQLGMPNVAMRRVIEDMRFVAENGTIAVLIDAVWEHWANQGPYNYMLAQMAWNPYADGEAILEDYYQRAFGPAASAMKDYWGLMEKTSDEIVFTDKTAAEVWNDAFYRQAYAHMDRAEKAAAGAPEGYGKRLAFVRAGLDYMRLYYETEAMIARMLRAEAKGEKDAEAEITARANWEKLEKIFTEHPTAFDPVRIGVPRGRTGLGRMRRVHPDYYKTGATVVPEFQGAAGETAALVPAEQAGWELVFSDDFQRNELGDKWKVIDGNWIVENGVLRGIGTLASAHGLPMDGTPAFQRMEFEVMTDVQPTASGAPPEISDFSSVLQGKLDADTPDFLKSAYFFQFGWKRNARTRISKVGKPIMADDRPQTLIEPGKVHRIVVEHERGRLRMFVNGKLVIAARDNQSLIGGGNDRVGLYFYTPAKVFNVKVYVKRVAEGLDMI